MPLSNFSNGFPSGVVVQNLPILNSYTGNVFWVDSVNGSNGNAGTFKRPFASIDYAVGRCTASHGDLIMVKAGHTESVAAAGGLTVDVAGIAIVFLGEGSNRGKIQFATLTSASVVVSAADIAFVNPLFVNNRDALIAGVQVSGSDVSFVNVDWRDNDAKNTLIAIKQTSASAVRMKIDGFKFTRGSEAGTQKTSSIYLTGGDGIVLKNIDIWGSFSDACVFGDTSAVTNMSLNDLRLRNIHAGPKPGINLVSTSTGFAKDVYIRVASGSSYVTDNDINWEHSFGYNTDNVAGDIVGGVAGGSEESHIMSVGVQASAIASTLTVADSAIDSVGIQVSATDSRLIVADAAVDSVGVQVSTGDSRLIVADSRLVVAESEIASVGIQVSTADSRLIVADNAVDSVGVQVSTTDSRLIVTDSKADSVGIQVSATDSRLIVTDSKTDSVGIQVSTADSRLIVADSRVTVAESEIASVGIQVSTADSRLIIADAAVDSVGVQASTTDSRLIVVDSLLVVAESEIASTGIQVSATDSRLIVADAAVDSVGVQVSSAHSLLIALSTIISTIDSHTTP